MSDYKINEELINEIREQFRVWALFLNNGIGLLAFTLGFASLGTNVPWINGIISSALLFLLWWQGSHYFPEKINSLRKESKKCKKAKILLKGLESEFLGLNTLIKKYPILLLGISFLVIISFSPIMVNLYPSMGAYFGL